MINDIKINSSGGVFWKEVETVESEEGSTFTSKCFRGSVFPGTDYNEMPDEVADFCRERWTTDVIRAWEERVTKE